MTLAFAYIHVPGCDCKRDGGAYAARLSRVRQNLIEGARADDVRAHLWLDDSVPDGSCLAWLDDAHAGMGWPGVHRDYHLLALYHEAIRLREPAKVARAAVESYDDTRRARGDWNGWDHVGEHDCADCRESARLRDAARATEDVERDAAETLTLALAAAPWGPQPDGSFIARSSTHVASGRHVHVLHAPAKQGPLVEVQDAERYDGAPYLRALRTSEEARTSREAERVRARLASRVYDGRRCRAGRALRDGGSLTYYPGQEYGTVALPQPHELQEFLRRRAAYYEEHPEHQELATGQGDDESSWFHPIEGEREGRREIDQAFEDAERVRALGSEHFVRALRRAAEPQAVSACGALVAAGFSKAEAVAALASVPCGAVGEMRLALRGVEVVS